MDDDEHDVPPGSLFTRRSSPHYNPNAGGLDSLFEAIWTLPKVADRSPWPSTTRSQRFALIALAMCLKEEDDLYSKHRGVRRTIDVIRLISGHAAATVAEALRQLEVSGWIRVDNRRKSSSEYFFSAAIGMHYELLCLRKSLTMADRVAAKMKYVSDLEQRLANTLHLNREWRERAKFEVQCEVIKLSSRRKEARPLPSSGT